MCEQEITMEEERFSTVEDIVQMLGVHDETVRRWLRTKKLRGCMLRPKADYRVRPTDLEAFLETKANTAAPN